MISTRLSLLALPALKYTRTAVLRATPLVNPSTPSAGVAVAALRPCLTSTRSASSNATEKETSLLDEDPRHVAEVILSRFPGYTAHNKACSALVLLSALAFLLSKEYIIVEAMTGEIYSFILASVLWYKMLGQTIREFIQTKRKNVGEFMDSFKEQHKIYFKNRLIENERLSQLPEISATLHAMSRDMLKMKAQIYSLKQINEVNEAVKNWLNANVSYEFTVRSSVQQWVANRVLTTLTTALKQPQTKNEVLKDAVLALEEFSKNH